MGAHAPRPQLHSIARERNEPQRINFVVHCLQNFTWPQFLWIDEAHKVRPRLRPRRPPHAASPALPPQNKRSSNPMHGWAFRGERTTTPCVFHRGKSYVVVPVISAFGVLDHYAVEGAGLDGVQFLDFLTRCVVRQRACVLVPDPAVAPR